MSALRIRGGTTLATPPRGDLVVTLRDGLIESVSAGESNLDIDESRLVVAPGFVDLQCNGGWGIDLTSEPERLWDLAAILPRHGVTAFLPTLVSCPRSVLEAALAVISERPAGFLGAEPLGWHLEGPMLDPRHRGAHDPSMLGRLGNHSIDRCRVAMVTLAPELDGALDVVQSLHKQGVVVAAGHTDATAGQLLDAVDAGLRAVTHLFNGMRPFHHREVGPAGVAMTDERLVAGLIADGIHVDPRAVTIAFATMGSRLALVTDSVAAAGCPEGAFRLGSRLINRLGDEIRDDRGALAGSVLTMDRAIRNLMSFTGCSLAEAVRAAAEVPAGLLGIDSGRLEPGMRGDLVLLTPDAEVVTTIVGGTVVFGDGAWKS